MKDLERLFTGKRPTADPCDPCGRIIPVGEVRVVYAATPLAVVTVCAHCHVKRLGTAVGKIWHSGSAVTS